MLFYVHGTVFSLKLIVSALKCAGLHLMWAKVNAVNSTPTQVFISYCRKAAFFVLFSFLFLNIWNVLLICRVRLLGFCLILNLFNWLPSCSPLWDYFHLFFRFCFSHTDEGEHYWSSFVICILSIFMLTFKRPHALASRLRQLYLWLMVLFLETLA